MDSWSSSSGETDTGVGTDTEVWDVFFFLFRDHLKD